MWNETDMNVLVKLQRKMHFSALFTRIWREHFPLFAARDDWHFVVKQAIILTCPWLKHKATLFILNLNLWLHELKFDFQLLPPGLFWVAGCPCLKGTGYCWLTIANRLDGRSLSVNTERKKVDNYRSLRSIFKRLRHLSQDWAILQPFWKVFKPISLIFQLFRNILLAFLIPFHPIKHHFPTRDTLYSKLIA